MIASASCVKILSQNDQALERHLLRANLDSHNITTKCFFTKSGCRDPKGDGFLT